MNHRDCLRLALVKAADDGVVLGAAGLAGGGALALGAHKGMESGLTYLTRQHPVTSKPFQNYYAGMAQQGFESGISDGPVLLPRFRRAIMGQMPSVTGLTDYETSRALGAEARHKLLQSGATIPGDTGTAVRQVAPMLQKARPESFSSPITRNLVRGLQNPGASPVVNWMQSHLVGPERQMASGLGKVIGDLATGTALHGPLGGISAALGGLPDAASYAAASRGKLDTLINLKSKILGLGFNQKLSPMWQRLMHLANPASAEVYHMGTDLRHLPQVEQLIGLTRSPLTAAANQVARTEAQQALLGPGRQRLAGAVIRDFPQLAKYLRFLRP